MSTHNARTMRIGLPAILAAVVTMALAAPQALGQFQLPRVLPSKTPPQPNTEAEPSSRLKVPSLANLKLPKLNASQQKLGTEVVGGAVGGALAGGAFGSFAGPAGTVIGAAGGGLAGGVGAAAATTFKDHARRHWGWR
jgi:hypothetical protein